jgi:hypothetical protein
MNFINCDKEYITARYEYLRDHMKGVPRLSIFDISNWEEPWGFGRQFKSEVNKIYREAYEIIYDDDPSDSISDDASCDFIIITLKTDTEIGIVWISEEEELFREVIENLFNAEVINKKSPVNIPASPTPKKPDNLVINKMHIFKNV